MSIVMPVPVTLVHAVDAVVFDDARRGAVIVVLISAAADTDGEKCGRSESDQGAHDAFPF